MPNDPATFYSRTKSARKIIVVDLGFLGDTVHLVPALWEIKKAYPDAALHVLSSPVGCELLRLVPCVNHSWPLEVKRGKASLGGQLRLIRELRRENFDVAFNFTGSDRTLFLTALTGAHWRLGHQGGRKHFWNRWLIPEWAPRQDRDLIVFEQRRRVLAFCGINLEPTRFGLRMDPQAEQWAAGIVPEGGLHISPNSSKPTREWSIDNHVALLRVLWERSPELKVVVTGGPGERERRRLRQLGEQIQDERLQVISEVIGIAQLAALLRRCRVHVGPDSGVLHLAYALGVPTVSFFREQGAYKSFMPGGPLHRVISVPCHCIDGRKAPCEQQGRAECFAQITPARAALLVTEQLRSS